MLIGLPSLCWAQVKFPSELTSFVPYGKGPVFTARGEGHWDVKIRERGWILREGDMYKMWFTGYDGTREGIKLVGYATSSDGVRWKRRDKPLISDRWIEDMMIVKRGDTYYMFAEGRGDQAQLLTSTDGINWKHIGKLDVRLKNGKPLPKGPLVRLRLGLKTAHGTCSTSAETRGFGWPSRPT